MDVVWRIFCLILLNFEYTVGQSTTSAAQKTAQTVTSHPSIVFTNTSEHITPSTTVTITNQTGSPNKPNSTTDIPKFTTPSFNGTVFTGSTNKPNSTTRYPTTVVTGSTNKPNSTTRYPTTVVTDYTVPSYDTTIFPNGSHLGETFARINKTQQNIANYIYDFHRYSYDGNNDIRDGGQDMYDYGNKVTFSIAGKSETRATYNAYYQSNGLYEFATITGWPFVSLMYIENKNQTDKAFSIEVQGDSGADGGGNLVYFGSNAVNPALNISIVYSVTQIYNAYTDPTICEVYFAISNGTTVSSSFYPDRESSSTNDIKSRATLSDYPSEAFLGYMLLSRKSGQYINPYEVEHALKILTSAIIDYNSTISFNFSVSTTVTPSFSSYYPYYTTPTYTRYAYEGAQMSICRNVRYSTQNSTECGGSRIASVLEITASVPTLLGYSTPMLAYFMSCKENRDSCEAGCSMAREITGNITLLQCNARCCSYSYCNYPYHNIFYRHGSSQYGNYTPPDITIPQEELSNVQVEILPNCVFKSFYPRLIACVSGIFEAWPFSSTGQCKVSLALALECGIREIQTYKTSDLFSTAMTRIPENFDFSEITSSLQQIGVLELLCETSPELFNATFTSFGPNNYTYSIPVFPGPISPGEPYCDNFILNSLIGWGFEYLTVLKTSTSRQTMCSYLNGLVEKILDAAENRCDFDQIGNLFPCDSVLRNQLRALIVQGKEMLPQIAPDYCKGVKPPAEPEQPDDIPLLPSCSLRQTIKSVWTCEKIFTSSTPYSDTDSCKSNINRLLHCVANRLQSCGEGNGFNIFDNLYPGFTLNNVVDQIRSLARPPSRQNRYHYTYQPFDFRDVFCGGASIPFPRAGQIPNIGNLFGICRDNISAEFFHQVAESYHSYAGAINSADVCMAFRSIRDWIYDEAKIKCQFELLQYLLPTGSPGGTVLTHGINIVIDILPELEISVCPEKPNNQTFAPNDWLQSYIRWRTQSLPRWQAAFTKWRSENGNEDHENMQMPDCIDLTGIRCQNPGMKSCDSDFNKCQFCSCLDNKYINLAQIVMAPWVQDYENWQNFLAIWEEKSDVWENEENY